MNPPSRDPSLEDTPLDGLPPSPGSPSRFLVDPRDPVGPALGGRTFREVVERACAGDARAFAALVEVLATPLLRFVTGVMRGDTHAAHDVVQETFLAAWRSIRHIQLRDQFRAWIFRVAHRRAVSWLRRRGPHGTPFVGLDEVFVGGEIAERATDRHQKFGPRGTCSYAREAGREGTSGARSADAGDAQGPSRGPTPRLRAVLQSLPAQYAAPLTLYYLESLDLKETARVLNVPVTTLKMRLCRGRGMLRRRLLAIEPWDRHPTRKLGGALHAPKSSLPAEPSARPERPLSVQPPLRPEQARRPEQTQRHEPTQRPEQEQREERPEVPPSSPRRALP